MAVQGDPRTGEKVWTLPLRDWTECEVTSDAFRPTMVTLRGPIDQLTTLMDHGPYNCGPDDYDFVVTVTATPKFKPGHYRYTGHVEHDRRPVDQRGASYYARPPWEGHAAPQPRAYRANWQRVKVTKWE